MHVLRDLCLHPVLILVHQTVVEDIGVGEAISSEGFFDLVHIYLSDPFIVEGIPLVIFKGFYIAEVVSSV